MVATSYVGIITVNSDATSGTNTRSCSGAGEISDRRVSLDSFIVANDTGGVFPGDVEPGETFDLIITSVNDGSMTVIGITNSLRGANPAYFPSIMPTTAPVYSSINVGDTASTSYRVTCSLTTPVGLHTFFVVNSIAGGAWTNQFQLNVRKETSSSVFGDDFDDNSKDGTKWGADRYAGGSGSFLNETNGHLEFTGGGGVTVVRPWIYSYGSYTQNWEISADIHVGNIALAQDDSDIEMTLGVAPKGEEDLTSNIFAIALDLYRDAGSSYREYLLYEAADGSQWYERYSDTTDEQGNLRITFDASTKVLTAYYNGNTLGSMDIDQSGSSWGMTSTSMFQVALSGYALGLDYTGSDVYADNFSVSGTVVDGDGNGLPDWWERQYFGGTGVNPDVICSNGINTVRQTYIAGLNPNDPQSRLLISDFRSLAAGKTLGWSAVSGRVYSVWWTTNLMTNFQCLESNIFWPQGSYTNPSTIPSGYYKIDVRMEE